MHKIRIGLTGPAFLLALVSLLLIYGCAQAPEVPPTGTEPGESVEEPAEDEPPITPDQPDPTEREGPFRPPLFLPDQVIVSGPGGQVDEVINEVMADPDVNADFIPVKSLVLWEELETCPGLFQSNTPDSNPESDLWVINLYGIEVRGLPPDVPTEPYIVSKINETAGHRPVRADAVYRVGDPIAADPHIGGGSPWTASSHPLTDKGSDSGDEVAAQGDFWKQWALGSEEGGIKLLDDDLDPTVPFEGNGIRVGVFDTYPLHNPQEVIDWITPTLILNIQEVESRNPLQFPLVDTPPPDADNHGLFVASLIHAVARESEIYSYRVLNEDRQGDLFTLNAAIHDFIEKTLPERRVPPAGCDDEGLVGAVINLSLGGYSVPYLLDLFKDAGVYPLVYRQMPRDVYSLKTILSAADCLDFTIVAAAGNDSLEEPQIPASFPESIAVGASNKQGIKSCFSNNNALILAPGGEGIESGEGSEDEEDSMVCKPRIETCLEACIGGDDSCVRECEWFALIGLVNITEDFPDGYAYWAGTSFSTPLVSGLAALALEQSQETWPSAEDVDDLIERISSGVAEHGGVVDIPQTMAAFEGAACPAPTP